MARGCVLISFAVDRQRTLFEESVRHLQPIVIVSLRCNPGFEEKSLHPLNCTFDK